MNTTTERPVAVGIARCPSCKKAFRVTGNISRYDAGYGRSARRVNWPVIRCCVPGPLLVQEIKGRETAEPCGAKCTSAVGPNCDCSCGGKNHGAAYA